MIRIREIDHLVLRVANLDAMLKFYCDVLGCTVERRQEAIGLIQLRAGRSLLDLAPVDGKLGSAGGSAPGKEGRNLDHFCSNSILLTSPVFAVILKPMVWNPD